MGNLFKGYYSNSQSDKCLYQGLHRGSEVKKIGRDIMEEKFDEAGKEEGQIPIQPS